MGLTGHVRAAATVAPIDRDIAIESVTIGKFVLGPNGLTVTSAPTFEEWEAIGDLLAVQVRGLQFMVGDWLRLGEAHFGELAAQAIDARKWSDSTVRVYRHIAGKVAPETRMLDRGLDYSHHQAVAALAPAEQRTWLKRALGDDEDGPWPVARLKAALKLGRDVEPSAWFVLAELPSKAKRDALLKRLELEGIACKASERRKNTT